MVFYRTPTIQGIWDAKQNWCLNAGVKYAFAKNRAIFSLQGNDLFESLYPNVDVDAVGQRQYIRQHFFRRTITLGFTYKFKGFKGRHRQEVDTSRYGVE